VPKTAVTEADPPLVALENAGIIRDGRAIVRGVSFAVSRREIVTLIGPNGSGKSTTAKLALGIWRADEGAVRRQAGIRTSYVPQSLAIDWTLPLSVTRFMTLTGPVSAAGRLQALERTGTAHLADAQVRHLSGGEFQRVLLARAIARAPDLLVLDEPVQGVDFAGEVALYELISGIRDETGCGILLISHDPHLVMAATDKVICLNGHVCCQGTPRAVAESAEYRDLFGEKAAQALAVYEHHHDHTHLPDGRVIHGGAEKGEGDGHAG
jgi:zinc transport system ATP-binding protein